MNQPDPAQTGFSRRSLLLGTGGGALAGLLAGAGIGSGLTTSPAPEQTSPDVPGAGEPVSATGETQAGVTRPETPQIHGLVLVADIDTARSASSLAALSNTLVELTQERAPEVLLDGPADLSVLVGVGPNVLTGSAHPELAELLEMPAYAGDDALEPHMLGGDLLLSISSSNPTDLDPVAIHLSSVVEGFSLRWQKLGFRGPGDNGVARNPLGYHDGVIVPRGDEELSESVWLDDGPLANGTICVIRTFALDLETFGALSAQEKDAVIGRDRSTGVPLSGGELHSEVQLTAKREDGEFVIPNRAHVRAAHPSFTGSDLMLRRSYSYMSPGPDGPEHGLMFTAFQKDIQAFVKTQLRMDEMDALMDFSTVRSTAAFAILPGFSADQPLGSTLF